MLSRRSHGNSRSATLAAIRRAAIESLEGRVLLAATPVSGLTGQYFNNLTLAGTPAATRVDKTVNFNWGGTPGVSGVGADNFSVRWTGQVTPEFSGAYTFFTRSDDGVRLTVNGQKIIDNWTKHAPVENSGTINLTAGVPADVTLEYFEASGGAVAQLSWQHASQPRQIIPESRLSTTAATPDDPPPTNGGGTGLLGSYFDNPDFTNLKLTRVDAGVNFNWGQAAPAPSMGVDEFSVRWAGKVTAPTTGAWTFYTKSDDGARLTVNGQTLINKLIPQGPTEYAGTINLTAGQSVDVVLDYFDRFGGASASLSWAGPGTAKQVIPAAALTPAGVVTPPPPTPGSGDGLTGTYYDNADFTNPKLTRVDPQVNVDWGIGAPALGIGADTFSVRWTGQVLAQKSETYTFYIKSDDGARLTVNGKVLVDKMKIQPATEYGGTIALVAGQKYNIQLDYYDNTGGASAVLSWSSPTTAKQVIPKSQLFSGGIVNPPPGDTKPAVPGAFAATALSASQIRLNWTDVATETGYKLERSPDGTTNWTQVAAPSANTTSYTDSGLAANTKYFYRLRANNAAGDSAYTAVANATTQNVVTPPPPGGTYQPDQIIQVHKDASFLGDNIINQTGDNQTKTANGDFYTTIFKIRVYNDGKTADSFIINGPKGDANWRVEYYDSFAFGWSGGKNITADVTGNGWNTGNVDPGQYREYRVELLPYAAPGGDVRSLTVGARSTHDATKVDVVKGVITNPVVRKLAWRRNNFDRNGTYLMRVENQGNLPDQFTINAAPLGPGFSVQFFDDQWGGNEVTAAVRSGAGWKTKALQPYEAQEFRVVFSGYANLNTPTVNLTAASVGKPDTKETLTVNIPPVQKNVTTPDGSFPIGIWTQPRSQFAKWKARGINTLIEYQGDGATLEEWTQTAREQGLFYIRRPMPNEFLDVGDKNLLAWSLPDEPEITTRFPPSELQKWIDEWKQADPNRPIWANFSGGWVLGQQGNLTAAGYQPYTTLADWESSSIYPVTGWNRPIEHPGLDFPGQSLDRLEKWSNGNPQFAVLESGDQELSWIQQEIGGPTPGQFRAEVWDSIIQGARGVIYFPMSFSPKFKYDNTPPEIVSEMLVQHAKIQSISQALLSDIDPPSRGLQTDKPLEGTWRVYNGKTYYVILNLSNATVNGSLTLQGVGGATTAAVTGEGRSVTLSGGAFTDTFTPYAVHVYEVTTGAAPAAAKTVVAQPLPFATANPIKSSIFADDDAGLFT